MASLLSSTKYLEENYQSFTTKNRIRENTSQNIEWGWYYSRSKSDTSQKKKIIDQYILWKFTWKDKIKILNLINSEINWASICFKDFFLSLNGVFLFSFFFFPLSWLLRIKFVLLKGDKFNVYLVFAHS